MECPKCSQKVLRSQLVKNYNTNLLENILTAAEETGYTTSNLNLITIARQVIGLEKVSDNFIVLFFYLLSVQEVCATRTSICVIGHGEDLMKSSDSRIYFAFINHQIIE